MFSRFSFYFFGFFICVSNFSCGIKIGEKNVEPRATELSSVKCLDQSISSLKRYFNAEAGDLEIESSIDCLIETVKTFSDTVNGQDKTAFTVGEVRYFLNKNIVKSGSAISENFAREVMKFKVAYLGGTEHVLTKTELLSLRTHLSTLKPLIVGLNQHMGYLTMMQPSDVAPAQKEARYNRARGALNELLETFSSHFALADGASAAPRPAAPQPAARYNIHSALALIEEALSFGQAEESAFEKLERFKPVVLAVKSYLIGSGLEINPQDWRHVARAVSDVLLLTVRYHYFVKVPPEVLDQMETRDKIVRFAEFVEDIALDVHHLLESQSLRGLEIEQMREIANGAFIACKMRETFLTIEAVTEIDRLKIAVLDQGLTSLNAWSSEDFLSVAQLTRPILDHVGTLLNPLVGQAIHRWEKDHALFSRMEENYVISAAKLGSLVRGSYDISHVKPLVLGLDQSGFSFDAQFLAEYDQYYRLLLSGKEAVTSVTGSLLTSRQIGRLLEIAARGYMHALEVKNFVKPYEMNDIEFSRILSSMLPKAKQTVGKILEINADRELSVDRLIESYINYCADFKVKPFMTKDSFTIVGRVLLSHVLIDFQSRIEGQVLTGLNAGAFNNLFGYVEFFFRSNLIAGEVFRPKASLTQNEVVQGLNALIKSNNDPLRGELLAEMVQALSGPIPLTLGKEKLLKIFDPLQDRSTYADLVFSNVARLITRLLMRSYVVDLDRARSLKGLTVDELRFAFEQLKSVAYELDVVSRRAGDFMGKRFQEANLFVPHANGDEFVGYLEGHDLILHIISGTERANLMKPGIKSSCLPPGGPELTRLTEIPEECLLNFYFEQNLGLAHVPHYTDMKGLIGPVKMKEHIANLLRAGGHIPKPEKIVLLDDANNFPHVVQYVEMMYARFDADNNRELTKTEALTAFPIFKKMIGDVIATMPEADKIKEEDYPGVFIYFLKNGRGPKSALEKLNFMIFIGKESKWDSLHAQRFDVGAVFGFIADSTAAAAVPKP